MQLRAIIHKLKREVFYKFNASRKTMIKQNNTTQQICTMQYNNQNWNEQTFFRTMLNHVEKKTIFPNKMSI